MCLVSSSSGTNNARHIICAIGEFYFFFISCLLNQLLFTGSYLQNTRPKRAQTKYHMSFGPLVSR